MECSLGAAALVPFVHGPVRREAEAVPRGRKTSAHPPEAQPYTHGERHPIRPDIGVEPEFRRHGPRKPPTTYRYDPSLDPQLSWDLNPVREQGEALIAAILESTDQAERADTPEVERRAALARARVAARQLSAMGRPFLNWAGKGERAEAQVPTLPLFVHERLSTQAVLASVRGMKRTKATAVSLFADEGLDISDRVLKAYEHQAPWTNRMILGDSLLVMNSLLQYEGLGGKVQMIYMDPPYGVKFGSNFQPFVRRRDVKHGSDGDLTREPEMVQAYRDTWALGLHSYMTYLRDRILVARDLLLPSGSMFVQIGDENLHHVRELMEEVFGPSNFVSLVTFRKKGMPLGSQWLEGTVDYLLWFARDKNRMKYHQLYVQKQTEGDSHWDRVQLLDGTRRKLTSQELANHGLVPPGAEIYQLHQLYPAGVNQSGVFSFEYDGRVYHPPAGRSWKTNRAGMARLARADRLEPYADGTTLRYVLKLSDYPVTPLNNLWADLGSATDVVYAVQTNTDVVQRCLLMTTDPGDIVLDPTCGSGTTAYVAEQWGRRWITIDTSRVPLALARQRLLTATFPWHRLKDPSRGPSGGFVYERRQDSRGREVGGIVPHVTLKSIAQDLEPEQEVLVDRPEVDSDIVRVAGPFTVEAVIPPAIPAEEQGPQESPGAGEDGVAYGGSTHDRLLEALRGSPVLRLPGGQTVTFRGVRRTDRAISLHAEAETGADGTGERVAFAFGPEEAPVTETQVLEAAREANVRGYTRLFVIGFAVEDAATKLLHTERSMLPLPVAYVQATMDLQMGDLLKNTRSAQVFAVVGAPDVRLLRLRTQRDGEPLYRVQLLGLDTFDPVTMDAHHLGGEDVPAWMLDTDYDDLVFRASQVFFPRTGAWDHLQRALRGVYQDSVWQHLAGALSEPFPAGERRRVAVKVIDDRGNDLLVTRTLAEAVPEP